MKPRSAALSVNEIFAQLPEIRRPGQENESKPVRKLRILGYYIAESDVEADLAKGVVGELGQKIRECAKNGGFPLNVLDFMRAGLTPQPKARRRYSAAPRLITRENERDNALFGRLGEIFVYELLRARSIAGFDETAWQSQNRWEYLGEGQGNDSLGYDFCFKDASGALTRCAGTVCMLEVKSSSGDAAGPFQMSENEWARAIVAHQNPDEEYMILRVARVSDSPALVDIIRDPYGLRKESKLQLVAGDFWVHVGELLQQQDGTNLRTTPPIPD